MSKLRTRLLVAVGGLMAVAISTGVRAQLAPDPTADFEAALRSAAAEPRAAPARTATPAVRPTGRGGNRIMLPSAGTIPPLFRSVPGTRAALTQALDAIRRGELDPYAFIEQVAGPMPLPPGAHAMRCRIWGGEAMYTLGHEAAPEVRQAMERAVQEQASGMQVPAVVMRGGEILPASATMQAMLFDKHAGDRPENRRILAELTTHLQSHGYRAQRFFLGDMTFLPVAAQVGRVALKLTYHHSSFHMQDHCRKVGLTMPTGPYVIAELYFPEPEQ